MEIRRSRSSSRLLLQARIGIRTEWLRTPLLFDRTKEPIRKTCKGASQILVPRGQWIKVPISSRMSETLPKPSIRYQILTAVLSSSSNCLHLQHYRWTDLRLIMMAFQDRDNYLNDKQSLNAG